MTDDEKLTRLEELEKKINKLTKKGYQITSELRTLAEVTDSPCPIWAAEGIEKFHSWCTDSIKSDRKFIYKRQAKEKEREEEKES